MNEESWTRNPIPVVLGLRKHWSSNLEVLRLKSFDFQLRYSLIHHSDWFPTISAFRRSHCAQALVWHFKSWSPVNKPIDYFVHFSEQHSAAKVKLEFFYALT